MESPEISSVADIFAVLGGNAEFARAIGVGPSTASEMKRRGRIPPEYWQSLIRSARAKGQTAIDAETLVRLHARKPAAPDSAEPRQSSMEPDNVGHFGRFFGVRRSNFSSEEAVIAHVRALRDEWDRR